MALPFTIRVPMLPRLSGAMDPGSDVRVAVPEELQFLLTRREVVGYFCALCRDADPSQAIYAYRSPEWEWSERAVQDGVPPLVMQWTHAHAEMHQRIRFIEDRQRGARRA